MLGIGPGAAIALVFLMLLWRWALTMTALLSPPAGPKLVLETIAASHFVEKVRWSMDRLGVEYTERQNAGVLGVFFVGRTVPKLHARTGMVTSTIGNSSDILRYLWGRYAMEYGERAAFLAPSREALDLERELDIYGRYMQQWIYHNILPHRSLTLHAWGCDDPTVPAWQRGAVRFGSPFLRALMRRAFRLSPATHPKTLARASEFLQKIEDRLGDGRKTLLGGEEISFVDITFASLSGLWMFPDNYGGGKADRVTPHGFALPAPMQAEIDDWRQRFPRVVALVERLYATERMTGTG
jgi:glutathione S-transferase